MKNIILFGFMGTGKTTVAKILADELKMKFVDMDSVIEERERTSIKRVFAERGAQYFRKLERDLVKELSLQDGLVVSTGGGVVLNLDNVKDFENTGFLFCLNAEPEEIFRRIKHEKHRPLLNVGDSLTEIKKLLESRKPYYEKIPVQVDTMGKSVVEIVREIKDSVERIA